MTRASLITLFLVLACAHTPTPVHAAKKVGPNWAAKALRTPSHAKLKAPKSYKVALSTTRGEIQIEVTRSWAPRGADRFYNLVRMGFYTRVAFFRVIKGFMTQFGIHGDPAIARIWRFATIKDDKVKQKNQRGMVSFATGGPGTRTTQVFINTADNRKLSAQGFAPFGRVIAGMNVVDALYAEYGEGKPQGQGPEQGTFQREGNAYLQAFFPKLDYIKSARLL